MEKVKEMVPMPLATPEKYPITETKEALEGMLELSIVMAEVLRDGAQLSDIALVFEKLTTDPVLKAKLMAAYDKISMVPKEIGDCSIPEGIELAMTSAMYVPRFLEAMKR